VVKLRTGRRGSAQHRALAHHRAKRRKKKMSATKNPTQKRQCRKYIEEREKIARGAVTETRTWNTDEKD